MKQKNIQIMLVIICTLFLSANLVSAWTPIVEPISNQELKIGDMFNYQVIASDEDGDSLTYEMDPYNIGLGFQISNSGLITWDPQANSIDPSVYPVAVYVADNETDVSVQFNITVVPADNPNPTNSAPTIQTIPDQTTTLGENFTYQVQASDSDGDSLLYTINRVCSASEMNELGCPDLGMGITQTGLIYWNPQQERYAPVNFTINVSVTDRINPPVSTLMLLTVHNPEPIVENIPDQTVKIGELVTFKINVTNFPLWEILYFTLDTVSFNKGMSIANGTFSWQPTNTVEPGAHAVNINITDMANPAIQKTFIINVLPDNTTNQTNNSAPVVQPIPNQTIMPGDNLSLQVVATDADNDTLTYSLNTNEVGMTIDNNSGLFAWNTANTTAQGNHTINIRVSDGFNLPVGISFIVTVGNNTNQTNQTNNTAPTIQPIPNQTIMPGDNLSLQIMATDAENNTLNYSIDANQIGMSIDEGLFMWNTTNETALGNYTVNVAVSDGNLTANSAFMISVVNTTIIPPINNSNQTLAITVLNNLGENSKIECDQAIAVEIAGDPNTITAQVFLMNSSGQVVAQQNMAYFAQTKSWGASFTQLESIKEGNYSFKINASDIFGNKDSETIGVNLPQLVCVALTPQTCNVNPLTGGNCEFTFYTRARGANAVQLSLKDVNGWTPQFLNATISSALGSAAVGNVNFNSTPIFNGQNLTLMNENYGSSSFKLSLTIPANVTGVINLNADYFINPVIVNQVNNTAPTIQPIPNQTIMLGENISLQINATDVNNDTLIYTIPQSEPGMQIDAISGLFTWNTVNTTIGNYTIVVSVSDVFNPKVNSSFMITVMNSTIPGNQTNNTAPTIQPIPNQTIMPGDNLSLQIMATDAENNTLNYSIDVNQTGMSIDQAGLFIWNTTNETALGNYTINVMVSDGNLTSTAAFMISVVNTTMPVENNTAPVWSVIPDQKVILKETFTINLAEYVTDAENDTLLFTVGQGINGSEAIIPQTSINSQTGMLTIDTLSQNTLPGNYTIPVLVKDNFHDFSSTTLLLLVVNDTDSVNNSAPTIEEIPHQTVVLGDVLSLQINALDSDGDALTYSVASNDEGLTIDPQTGLITFDTSSPAVTSGEYSEEVFVSDGISPPTVSTLFFLTVLPPEEETNETEETSQVGAQ